MRRRSLLDRLLPAWVVVGVRDDEDANQVVTCRWRDSVADERQGQRHEGGGGVGVHRHLSAWPVCDFRAGLSHDRLVLYKYIPRSKIYSIIIVYSSTVMITGAVVMRMTGV